VSVIRRDAGHDTFFPALAHVEPEANEIALRKRKEEIKMRLATHKTAFGWAFTILTLALSATGTIRAQAAIPLKFHGGRILTTFTIYPVYYGNWSDTSTQQAYLVALARHMSGQDAPAGQKPMIWQYGVNQVSVAAGVKTSQPAITPRTVTDSDIVDIIHQNQLPTTQVSCQATTPGSKPVCKTVVVAPAKLPAYGPGVLILVLLAKEYPLNCGGNCGAYHDSESSVAYYAAVPHYDDFSTQSIKVSHEVFEAAANPAGWRRTANGDTWVEGDAGWDELSDQCGGISIGSIVVTSAHDNTLTQPMHWPDDQRPACSVTGYIRPATTSSAASSALPSYSRSDQTSSVLYIGFDGHIHEIYLPAGTSSWKAGDLFNPGAATTLDAAGRPAAYVRTDGINSVVYRAVDNHIHEISLRPGGAWQSADLVALTGATAAAGEPAAYRRFDNVSSVVYRGVDSHIHELYLTPGGTAWQSGDLFPGTSAPFAAGDPSVCVLFDGTSSVVYRGMDNHIHQLYLKPGSATWQTTDLSSQAAAQPAGGDPVSYVRFEGTNSVIYRGSDNHLYELYLNGGTTWKAGDLTAQTGAPLAKENPAAYVRFDGVNSVVYRATDDRIHELYLTPQRSAWQTGDLFAYTQAPSAWGPPTAYRRFDNVDSVVYLGSDTHVHELYLSPGSNSWQAGDLSALGGAPSAR
jgi:hypothetical protein